jgi:hypothetical protein
MLRNELAHGVDLRKAASDKNTPVDLVKKVQLIPNQWPMRTCLVRQQFSSTVKFCRRAYEEVGPTLLPSGKVSPCSAIAFCRFSSGFS